MFREDFTRHQGGDESVSNEGEDDDSSESESESESRSHDEPKKKKAKKEDTSTFKFKVHQVLKRATVVGGGEFAISKHVSRAPAVVISIKDGGKMRFPMYEDDIEQFIDTFEKSPYGKGTKTILDTSFRNSWQLDPDGFTILNPEWDTFISDVLVPLIGKEFLITSPFTASLYKLLLYKEDSFFKLHRDSEKEPGMFATVVVQLPSKYTGGELVVHHGNKTKTIDFSSTSSQNAEFSTCFSVFYCDCLHEIRPITSGIRVCLIYNLCLTGENVVPLTAPTISSAEIQLGALMRLWKEMELKEPSKLVYALSHKYSEKNLSFENLKSTDKAVANLFKQISTEQGISVLLAIFEKTSKGNGCGYDDQDFDSDDPDCNCETDYELSNFKMLEPSAANHQWILEIKSLTVEPEFEVIPEDCWSSIEPYDEEREETGNEGTHVSLFYRHAALVIWPKDDFLEVLVHSGGDTFVLERFFLEECSKVRSTPMDDQMKAKAEERLHKLANTMVKGVRSPTIDAVQYGQGMKLLLAIVDFNDLTLLKGFLKFRNAINSSKIPILLDQCEKYGWPCLSDELVAMFDRLVKGSGKSKQALEMLRRIIGPGAKAGLNEEKRFVCLKLGQSILTNWKTKWTTRQNYYPYARVRNHPAQILDAREASRFLQDFYMTVKWIGFDMVPIVDAMPLMVIVPTLLQTAADAAAKGETPEYSWVEMGESVLKRMELVASKPVAIPDWRRNDFKSCGCQDCVAVKTFMDSTEVVGRFKMGKPRRRHLEQNMNVMRDVTHITEPGGSPLTMVVTKTSMLRADEYEEQQFVISQQDKLKELIESAKAKGQDQATTSAR